jgi:hypothetical protein
MLRGRSEERGEFGVGAVKWSEHLACMAVGRERGVEKGRQGKNAASEE